MRMAFPDFCAENLNYCKKKNIYINFNSELTGGVHFAFQNGERNNFPMWLDEQEKQVAEGMICDKSLE